MLYQIPKLSINLDLEENLKNIEKTIDTLNIRRDKELDSSFEEKLKKHLIISSVYNSNAIEGNKLSLRETELILNGMVVNERPLKDELEAKSLASATEYLYKLIDGREPLSKRTLLELHSLLMEPIPNIKGGQFRNEEVSIKNSNHKPIFWTHIDDEVDHMFKWMNRNSHKFDPIVMCSILHHWLSWIHPFSDGNGRTARLFSNFYLLQKGYPEIVIKIGDRDKYYNALISSDNNNITPLVELLADKVRQTVTVYEEFLNEAERQDAWKKKYQQLTTEKYEKAKETYSYQYEVWKNQIGVFKLMLAENIKELQNILPNINFYFKEYDILSYSQYLDILEDRKVSNTWYINLSIQHLETRESISFIFYFERFYLSNIINISKDTDANSPKKANPNKKPEIKLYVTARGNSGSIDLDSTIDLINVGTWGDQLSFGVRNRVGQMGRGDKRVSVITVKDNPGGVIRRFIDQILLQYFQVGEKKTKAIRFTNFNKNR